MTAPGNPFPALARTIDPAILHSIHRASQATSTDFGLLMAQAAQESDFRANAKSSTSSASGLYQFIDSTWLDMVRRFGAKYGAGELAQKIEQDGNGKFVVTDPAMRKKILDLRQDPALSAALAGEYTRLNQTEVERALGHGVQRADLYMAHFLGASGAATFLKAVESKGNIAAADLLPDAASANKGIFYDSQTGKARSVADIYHSLTRKIEKIASDFGGLVPAAAPDKTQTPSSSSTANDTSPLSAIGQKILWPGLKLSNMVMDMLNVVALAALKMTGSDSAGPDLSTRPTQPRDRRSI